MLNIKKSIIVIIDEQEKLIDAIHPSDNIVINTAKLAKAAKILSIPVIVTEQYPAGLGDTADVLKNNLDENTVFLEKSSFSAMNEPEFARRITSYRRKQVLLCGIETHICVLQTALSLLENGYDVYVLKDCCASRHSFENDIAFELLRQYGVGIISVEIALFDLLETSKHTNFKEIQALVK